MAWRGLLWVVLGLLGLAAGAQVTGRWQDWRRSSTGTFGTSFIYNRHMVSLTPPLDALGTVSLTDVKLTKNGALPSEKCASAADEGRMVLTADGPYVCQMR